MESIVALVVLFTGLFITYKLFFDPYRNNNFARRLPFKIFQDFIGVDTSSYGDILLYETPNAKLSMTVSYKYFGRIDEAKADIALIPDYEVKAEEAMDKLYEIIVAKK
ncbi:MAG: hypothetical protein K0S01_374 [Herbinix sp.]|nr:hypothetical protein [Herbinix sp.]